MNRAPVCCWFLTGNITLWIVYVRTLSYSQSVSHRSALGRRGSSVQEIWVVCFYFLLFLAILHGVVSCNNSEGELWWCRTRGKLIYYPSILEQTLKNGVVWLAPWESIRCVTAMSDYTAFNLTRVNVTVLKWDLSCNTNNTNMNYVNYIRFIYSQVIWSAHMWL